MRAVASTHLSHCVCVCVCVCVCGVAGAGAVEAAHLAGLICRLAPEFRAFVNSIGGCAGAVCSCGGVCRCRVFPAGNHSCDNRAATPRPERQGRPQLLTMPTARTDALTTKRGAGAVAAAVGNRVLSCAASMRGALLACACASTVVLMPLVLAADAGMLRRHAVKPCMPVRLLETAWCFSCSGKGIPNSQQQESVLHKRLLPAGGAAAPPAGEWMHDCTAHTRAPQLLCATVCFVCGACGVCACRVRRHGMHAHFAASPAAAQQLPRAVRGSLLVFRGALLGMSTTRVGAGTSAMQAAARGGGACVGRPFHTLCCSCVLRAAHVCAAGVPALRCALESIAAGASMVMGARQGVGVEPLCVCAPRPTGASAVHAPLAAPCACVPARVRVCARGLRVSCVWCPQPAAAQCALPCSRPRQATSSTPLLTFCPTLALARRPSSTQQLSTAMQCPVRVILRMCMWPAAFVTFFNLCLLVCAGLLPALPCMLGGPLLLCEARVVRVCMRMCMHARCVVVEVWSDCLRAASAHTVPLGPLAVVLRRCVVSCVVRGCVRLCVCVCVSSCEFRCTHAAIFALSNACALACTGLHRAPTMRARGSCCDGGSSGRRMHG
jgi:hypothetical protein